MQLLGEDFNSSLLFNPLNHLQLSLIGPESVTVWTVENCNDIMSLKAKYVCLDIFCFLPFDKAGINQCCPRSVIPELCNGPHP